MVLAIVAVIMGASLVGYMGVRKSARDGKRKADLEQIRAALEIYRNDQRTYPAGNLLFGTGALAFGGETYMELVPNDPLSPTYSYSYRYLSPNQYYLCARLETVGTVATNCLNSCGSLTCNYQVANP